MNLCALISYNSPNLSNSRHIAKHERTDRQIKDWMENYEIWD